VEDGVTVKAVPVPIIVPLQEASYQFHVAEDPNCPPTIFRVVAPPVQNLLELAWITEGAIEPYFV